MITWKSIAKDKIGGHDFVRLDIGDELVGLACENCNLTMTFVEHMYPDQLKDYQSNVGPGWAPLVTQAFAFCKKRGIIITDIKEKYGTLRIYTDYYDEDVEEMLERIDWVSAHMCERCGKPGKPRSTGWIKTLCFRHYVGAQIGRKWQYFKWRWLPRLSAKEVVKKIEEKRYEK